MGTQDGNAEAFMALMLESGLSAAMLARAARVSRRNVARAEAGEPVMADTRERLAGVLGEAVYGVVALAARPASHDTMAARRRAELGWSLAEAAQRMGVARDTLARAERGRRVQPRTAKRIADAYGISVLDVLSVEQHRGNRDAVAA